MQIRYYKIIKKIFLIKDKKYRKNCLKLWQYIREKEKKGIEISYHHHIFNSILNDNIKDNVKRKNNKIL